MCLAVSCRSPLCLVPELPRGVNEWEVTLFQLVFSFQLKYVCMLTLALDLYMYVLSFPRCCHVFLSTPWLQECCMRNTLVVVFSAEAPQSVVMVMEPLACEAMPEHANRGKLQHGSVEHPVHC